jgi:hypothetical protein
VAHILTTPNLRLVYSDKELGLLAARLTVDQRLRGADATYVAVARWLNIPLVTGDQERLDRASAADSVQTPEQESWPLAAFNPSQKPALLAGGRFVAFRSFAANLVSGDTSGKLDIFLRDRGAWATPSPRSNEAVSWRRSPSEPRLTTHPKP